MADKKLVKITGTVVLVKSKVLGFNDFIDSFLDGAQDFVVRGITFQLVNAADGDPKNGNKGEVGKPSELEKWSTTGTFLGAGGSGFRLTFEWDDQMGIPGTVIVNNNLRNEFSQS